jgi:Zn-dependent M16 (insulinase) family peptidase
MNKATHGFELVREATIPEIASTAKLYRHRKTGGELLSLINRDENKVFGATFRTPPEDSTGVAHILEHSVLCGTRKYRVKDPFAELAKSSLNTFLNAMTYPDKTTYPTASTNLKDFYNLVDVYLDCVFHPQLTRETFLRQGWHYEVEAHQSEMIYKGVVFNEMKGNYASADNVLADCSQRVLFPDNTYGFDSGGDPAEILDLTHDKLVAFYKRYYHPSNCRLFFYGDDAPEERLRRLDAVLDEFEPLSVASSVALQSRFDRPRRTTRSFAAAAGGDAGRQAKITVNWMLDEVGNAENDLALSILDHILIGTPAAPLRKALLESGLGEDLAGHGLDQDLRQAKFSVGLKGIAESDADKVEALILDTLRGLVASGIDQATIEAALNTTEFSLREQNTGGFPRGLGLMLAAMRPWLHGHDPLAPLAFEAPLAAIKKRLAAGERLFEGLIERQLTGNPHRVTVVLKPDAGQAERENKAEHTRLERERAAMSPDDVKELVETTTRLCEQTEAPDSAEDLAAIPSLRLTDIERAVPVTPTMSATLAGTTVLTHEIPTNGIVYLDLALDLGTLPAGLLPWVKVVATALLETGAGDRDFVTLTEDIGRLTGGIRHEVFALTEAATGRAQCWLALRGKATPERTGDLADLLRDILTAPRLGDRERIRQIILEHKASLESRIVPAGSFVARVRLSASLYSAGLAEEMMGGASALAFLRELADRFDRDWDSIRLTLERVRAILVDRATMIANVTADAEGLRRIEPQLERLLADLPSISPVRPEWKLLDAPRGEGLTIPAKVNYVAKGALLPQLGHAVTGSTFVVKSHLDINWLWHKVRVQGGAYGGGCVLDRRSGLFAYYSYRDPNLTETLDVFDATADFLRSADISASDLERCIIGTIGEIEPYRLPDSRGYAAMQRHLVGDNDAVRQQVRDEVMATTVADVRNFSEAAAEIARRGRVVVIGSSAGIEAANSVLPEPLTIRKLL